MEFNNKVYQPKSLKERLKDWTDIDGAIHELNQCLGLTDKNWHEFCHSDGNKWVYWCDNKTGNMLGEILFSLVDYGLLERSSEESDDDKIRWNPNFKPNWEK